MGEDTGLVSTGYESGPPIPILESVGSVTLAAVVSFSWITSHDELRDIEDEWETLRETSGCSIFMSYSMDETWLRAYKNALPRVLILRENEQVVAILPLALHATMMGSMHAQSLTLVGGWRGRLRYRHMGLLIEPGRTDLVKSVAREMKKTEWDFLRMRFMSPNGVTQHLVSEMQNVCSCKEDSPTPAVTCAIPSTGDVLSNFGKKNRENMRYKMRRLERDGRVDFRTIRVEDVERAVDVHVKQHIERWKNRGGSFFVRPENVSFLKILAKTSIAKGYGFMKELLIDGQVAAQDFGLIDNGVARMYRGGMNDEFSQHSPGILLVCYEMERFREIGIKVLDMGRGNEEYKMQMGGQVDHLTNISGVRGLIPLIGRLERYHPRRIINLARARLSRTGES